MFTAIDKNGEIVDIEDAHIDEEYFCPICHAPLIIKAGLLNAAHFAHRAGECTDNWNYDTSLWHRQMQSYFPKEAREIVVTHEGKTHRADVLIDKTVIEIQHSPISAEEFADRNDFFHSLGYRIAWIFDVSEQYYNENLYFSDINKADLMIWKNPLRVFSAGRKPSDYDSEYSIWLYLGSDGYEDCYISKVIWCAENEYGEPSFKRLVVSEFSIYLYEHFEIDDFFLSKIGKIQREIEEFGRTHRYAIKYSGVNGKKKDYYVCPRTNTFGLNLYGSRSCSHCRYCFMILKKSRKNAKTETTVYCCYPNQINEVYTEDPDYESLEVEQYDI